MLESTLWTTGLCTERDLYAIGIEWPTTFRSPATRPVSQRSRALRQQPFIQLLQAHAVDAVHWQHWDHVAVVAVRRLADSAVVDEQDLGALDAVMCGDPM